MFGSIMPDALQRLPNEYSCCWRPIRRRLIGTCCNLVGKYTRAWEALPLGRRMEMCPPAGKDGVGRSGEVRVWLLSGFRVPLGPRTIEQDQWRLRKAAALVKLLALSSSHRLHREQVMDTL